jgi:RNA polymerase sigma-70 factor (ECF subfamily)
VDRGDEFDVFFRTYVGDVRAFCRRRADHALAEDVVAETFEIAWRRRDELPRTPKAWLLGVARRVLANRRRSDRRQASLARRVAAQPVPEEVDRSEDVGNVLEALGRLSRLDQEVLMLAAWDELSSREAAAVLGCSPVAFRLRLHRARRRLAATLGVQGNEPDGVSVRVGESRP